MDTRILCWNCQGARHLSFHNFLADYRKKFSLDLVCLLETRICEDRVDGVIAKLGFPNSFRVEANGFAGGIWLSWTDNIIVDILEVHFQMAHV